MNNFESKIEGKATDAEKTAKIIIDLISQIYTVNDKDIEAVKSALDPEYLHAFDESKEEEKINYSANS